MHKFKRKGIVSYKKLKELCNHLEQEGINGFQPTSAKTESYSGIVLYHKVKNK
jgi:dihydrodipicolinate synthase/N-acetylneuraminate lyase